MKKMCASCLNVKICVFLLPTQRLLLGGSWDNHVPQAPDRTLLRSRNGLDVPYRHKGMYHIAVTYYRSNATRI